MGAPLNTKTFFSCAIGLTMLALSAVPAHAFEGRAASKDGTVVVTYKVEEGYKISIRIDTKAKKMAYSESLKADVTSIKVDFLDVNNDGFQDVLIKYADETGYSPAILVNRNDQSFLRALPKTNEALYVNTELEITKEGKATRPKDYELRNVTGDRISELIFYKAFLDKKGYRHVVFRYDRRTASYVLHEKGALFVEPR